MPAAIKVSSVVTYSEGIPSIKSDYQSYAWSCQVT